MVAPGMDVNEPVRALFERLANDAGREIIAVRKSGFSVDNKSDGSPVTIADTRAEAAILKGLEIELPDMAFVCEEQISTGTVPPELGTCFILVDPLDGTREFTSGRDEFTVNIALIRDGVPEIGVVYAPATGIGYSARPGLAERYHQLPDGTVADRRRIDVNKDGIVRRIVASRSHRTAETDAFIAKYPDAQIVSVGSSLKFCLLAEGKADLYPRFGRTMEWDTAAGDAVLRAAGGKTRLVDGGEFTYGKRNQPDDCDFANSWFISSVG